MTPTQWNPLGPKSSWQAYERQVGDALNGYVAEPGSIASLFRSLPIDEDDLARLQKSRLTRCTSRNRRWMGASGYEHQIDECFTSEGDDVVVLVECKRHKSRCVGIPAFSTFLVRIMDIAASHKSSLVVGLIVTTQGPQGRWGGSEEDQDAVGKLRAHFCREGYPIGVQWLADWAP